VVWYRGSSFPRAQITMCSLKHSRIMDGRSSRESVPVPDYPSHADHHTGIRGKPHSILFPLSPELTRELKQPKIKRSTAIPRQAYTAPYALIKPMDASVAINQGDPAQDVSSGKRPFTILLRIAAQKEYLAFNPDNAVQNVSFPSGFRSALRQD
jgi:hypothetical protein